TRAMFYGATSRTLDGLRGAVFRKDPVLEGPPRLQELTENVTQTGKSMLSVARDVITEQLAVGRVGLLVDMPPTGGRPYLRVYTAESITNWREILVNGLPVLDQVVLREIAAEPAVNGFGSDFYVRYRVLTLD